MTPVDHVKVTIDETMEALRQQGYTPYFIMGGGHGNIGTQAYVNTYEEILAFEKEAGIKFDYIFHASGTGTTQAGLVCRAASSWRPGTENYRDQHCTEEALWKRCGRAECKGLSAEDRKRRTVSG